MSVFFRCPVCGKTCQCENYEPSEWDGVNVELMEFRGLGRGRGFEKIPVGDIEDDPELRDKLLIRVNEVKAYLESL